MAGISDHTARLGRVETEVGTIKSEMGSMRTDLNGLKSDVKAFGGILERIEAGVARAQDRSDEREVAGKPNLVAIITVLITVISIIVGGAWVISGQLARQDAAITKADQTAERLVDVRNREVDQLRDRVARNEEHLWETQGRLGSTRPPN